MGMAKDMKILIVDDFEMMRMLIKEILNTHGYENITEAGDGTEAMGVLKTQQVDLVISDSNMPNMTGMQLLTAVRSDSDLKSLPFLMVTADGCGNRIAEAIAAGVSSYLVKPFTNELFCQKFNGIVESIGSDAKYT